MIQCDCIQIEHKGVSQPIFCDKHIKTIHNKIWYKRHKRVAELLNQVVDGSLETGQFMLQYFEVLEEAQAHRYDHIALSSFNSLWLVINEKDMSV